MPKAFSCERDNVSHYRQNQTVLESRFYALFNYLKLFSPRRYANVIGMQKAQWRLYLAALRSM
jgi:hypothetical protein